MASSPDFSGRIRRLSLSKCSVKPCDRQAEQALAFRPGSRRVELTDIVRMDFFVSEETFSDGNLIHNGYGDGSLDNR